MQNKHHRVGVAISNDTRGAVCTDTIGASWGGIQARTCNLLCQDSGDNQYHSPLQPGIEVKRLPPSRSRTNAVVRGVTDRENVGRPLPFLLSPLVFPHLWLVWSSINIWRCGVGATGMDTLFEFRFFSAESVVEHDCCLLRRRFPENHEGCL